MSKQVADEAALVGLEQERRRALVAQDLASLDRLMSDDLVHVHTTGIVHDKTALFHHATEVLRFLNIERPDLKIRVYGDTAVMTGPMINTLSPVGRDDIVTVESFVTQVWTRRENKWRCVSFHAVKR